MARRFGSAMMANDDSIRRIYPLVHIPVKSYSGAGGTRADLREGSPLACRFARRRPRYVAATGPARRQRGQGRALPRLREGDELDEARIATWVKQAAARPTRSRSRGRPRAHSRGPRRTRPPAPQGPRSSGLRRCSTRGPTHSDHEQRGIAICSARIQTTERSPSIRRQNQKIHTDHVDVTLEEGVRSAAQQTLSPDPCPPLAVTSA